MIDHHQGGSGHAVTFPALLRLLAALCTVVALGLIYGFCRYGESVGDSANIIWLLNDAIARGEYRLGDVRHWFSDPVFHSWVELLEFADIGPRTLDQDLVRRFVVNIERLAWLNAWLMALVVILLYRLCRESGANRWWSFVAVGVFASSSGTWLLASSAERQVVPSLLLVLAYLGALRLSVGRAVIRLSLVWGAFQLATIVYMPAIQFLPSIALVALAGLKAHAPQSRLGHSAVLIVGTFFLADLAVGLLSGVSVTRLLGGAWDQWSHYATPTTTDQFGRLSWPMVINNLLTPLHYVAGWTFMLGVQTTDWSTFESGQELATFALSSGALFAALAIVLSHAVRVRCLGSRWERVLDAGLLTHVGLAVVVVWAARHGITQEFWLFSWIGLVPLLARALSYRWGASKGMATAGGLVVLTIAATNAWQGRDQFGVPTEKRHPASIARLEGAMAVAATVTTDDVMLSLSNMETYWLPLLTSGRVQVVPIDQLATPELNKKIDTALASGHRVFAVRAILESPVEQIRGEYGQVEHLDELRRRFAPSKAIVGAEVFDIIELARK